VPGELLVPEADPAAARFSVTSTIVLLFPGPLHEQQKSSALNLFYFFVLFVVDRYRNDCYI
tara:strand:- start:145 stop:327 length:183 start_codon:yes stop_codon:yes gene_type:complete